MSAYREGVPCPTCKSLSTTSEGECLACLAVWGEAFLCPFCAKHTRPVADALVQATCPACSGPRLGPSLDASSYGPLVARRRMYRLWHARALVYVPPIALAGALVAAGLAYRAREAGLAAIDAARSEMLVVPREAEVAAQLPEPAPVFGGALVGVGVLGLGVYAVVATVLRGRVMVEARRLAATGAP